MNQQSFVRWQFVGLWALTCLPLLLGNGYIGLDTPNHAARIYILAELLRGGASDSLHDFYQSHWTWLPNLGMDLLLVPLALVVPVGILMKLFIGITIGLTALGVRNLRQAIGFEPSIWDFSGFLFAFSYPLGFGFLNYLFGIAVGLLWVARILDDFHQKNRKVIFFVGIPTLILCHFMSAMLCFATLALLWLWKKPDCKKELGYGAGATLGLILLNLAISRVLGGVRGGMIFEPIIDRFSRLYSPLSIGAGKWDLIYLLGVGMVICLMLWRTPNWKPVAIALGIGALVFLISPQTAATSSFVSARIPYFVSVIAVSLVPSVKPDRIAISFVLLLIFRSIGVSSWQLSHRTFWVQVQQDLRQVPSNAVLYHAGEFGVRGYSSSPLDPYGWNPPTLHANCIVVLERPVLVANLFAFPSQQPLIFGEHYRQVPVKVYVHRTPDRKIQLSELQSALRMADDHWRALRAKRPELSSAWMYLARSRKSGDSVELDPKTVTIIDPSSSETIVRAEYILFRLR